MLSFHKVLDLVMGLPVADRDTLLDILNKRRIEERRKQLANEVRESLELYKSGKLSSQSAEEVIKELNSLLEDKI